MYVKVLKANLHSLKRTSELQTQWNKNMKKPCKKETLASYELFFHYVWRKVINVFNYIMTILNMYYLPVMS